MTFTRSDISKKLEDGSEETRRLLQLEPKDEVTQTLREVFPIESRDSSKSEQFQEDLRTFPRDRC